MNEKVSFKFDGDHVQVVVAAGYEFDPTGSNELWAELKQLCEKHKTRRVLIEGRAPDAEPDTADIVATGERTATVPKLWMAFHFDDFKPNEKSELFEAIAASKGVRVKHFSDRAHALKWLRNNAPG